MAKLFQNITVFTVFFLFCLNAAVVSRNYFFQSQTFELLPSHVKLGVLKIPTILSDPVKRIIRSQIDSVARKPVLLHTNSTQDHYLPNASAEHNYS